MKTDYNCFAGRWPFIKRRQAGFDALRKMHEKHGIESGYVSSLDAVFYNDPFEGDLGLSKEIKGAGYRHAISINPMLPNTEYDIKRADESFGYDAFRIYPTLHGYDFDTPQFTEFYHMATQKEKPLFIHCLFGDPRLDYLLKQRLFESESLGLFLKVDHSIPVVLCNMRLNDIYAMASYAGENNNVYYDMSELRHSMFAIDELSKAGLDDRMVFGSFYPVFDFRAAHIHFDGVDDSIKNKILNRSI